VIPGRRALPNAECHFGDMPGVMFAYLSQVRGRRADDLTGRSMTRLTSAVSGDALRELRGLGARADIVHCGDVV
jgi:hypothetical protein